MTADLFETLPIAGLDYRPGAISTAEEAELAEHILALDLSPFRFQQWQAKRLTHSYGWRYDFSDSSFRQTEPIPEWLAAGRAIAASLAGVPESAIAHVLVARYDPGAGIGWHRDRPVFDRVVGLSLGSEATIRFRQRTETGFRRAELRVERRSAYLLSGEARHDWEHSIVPGGEQRLSITFRTLSAFGRRKAGIG